MAGQRFILATVVMSALLIVPSYQIPGGRVSRQVDGDFVNPDQLDNPETDETGDRFASLDEYFANMQDGNQNRPNGNQNVPGGNNRPGRPNGNINSPNGNNNQQGGNNGQMNITPAPLPRPTPDPACVRRCPATPEYNPVCGTNRQQYDNVGRLMCAQQCGADVELLRTGNC